MLSFSEFEHDMIVQRTQEGKAIARQNADFKDSHPKKFSQAQLNHSLELLKTHSYKQVERLTQKAPYSTNYNQTTAMT